MNSKLSLPPCGFRSFFFYGVLAATAPSLVAQVVIDGNANEASYLTLGTTQTQVSNAGGNSTVLASIRSIASANTLHLGICGRATNHAIILFIDAKPGGVNRITPDLIDVQPGGEHEFINKLAQDGDVGLTFESGFIPETAIRIFGDEVTPEGGGANVKHAYVNVFNFLTHSHAYLGDSHAGVVSGGAIRQLKSDWQNVGSNPNPANTTAYATHLKGVEMDLNLTSLGVSGNGQTVKLCAILVSAMLQDDPESDRYIEGTNQGIAPFVTINNNSLFSAINQFNFQTEPGTQTLSVTVDGLDPMGDEDDDDLLNGVETNSGVFVDANNTGTNPLAPDTDGDGYPDGAEVTGSPTLGLGFVSDPNLANYTNMAVPGSFNRPTPWNANSAVNSPSTAMVRESTSLTGQYRWTLDYPFPSTQLGAFSYKFTSGGNFDIQWGGGPTPGVAIAGVSGSDIPNNAPASGFHRFSFDQKTLAYAFGRTVFANSAAFLTAYGLTAGTDSDGDGILNENEFPTNTDPTNADSDGDGYNDREDGYPFMAANTTGNYQDWAPSVIGDSSPSADPDHDQFSNFEEFLFGTPPNYATQSLTPTLRSGSNLLIRWLQRSNLAPYQLRESPTLQAGPWPLSPATVVSDPDQSNKPTGYVRMRATVPIDQARKFLRVTGND